MYTNELYHHGVKGQKWGVRRYQNEDGSLTAAGKKRYGEPNDGKKQKSTMRDRINSSIKSIDKKKAIKIGAAVVATTLVAVGAYKLNKSMDKKIINDLCAEGKKWADRFTEVEKLAQQVENSNASIEEKTKWAQRSFEIGNEASRYTNAASRYIGPGHKPTVGDKVVYFKNKGGSAGAKAVVDYTERRLNKKYGNTEKTLEYLRKKYGG